MLNHLQTAQRPMNFEIIPEEEDIWRKEITAMTVQLQDRRKALQDGEVLRGVHPKSHGCLVGRFNVNPDLPDDLRVGLFARPGKRFRALIRFSNADVLKRADIETEPDSAGNRIMKHGSRGMAIKVLGLRGHAMLSDDGQPAQDFLMVNTPEFAFRNVRDYRRLTMALLASPDASTPDLFFLPGELLKRGMMDMSGQLIEATGTESPQNAALRGAFLAHPDVFGDYTAEDVQGVISAGGVVQKIQATAIANPLASSYFGAASFRFGPDRVMRYSVTPDRAGVADIDESALANAGDDYLAEALAQAMNRRGPIRLRFRVQVADSDAIRGNEADMIENASKAWDETAFPHIEVARLVINPRRQDAELVDACKERFFTPWHSLPEHEPLGGINRLRKPVYATSATFRRTT